SNEKSSSSAPPPPVTTLLVPPLGAKYSAAAEPTRVSVPGEPITPTKSPQKPLPPPQLSPTTAGGVPPPNPAPALLPPSGMVTCAAVAAEQSRIANALPVPSRRSFPAPPAMSSLLAP